MIEKRIEVPVERIVEVPVEVTIFRPITREHVAEKEIFVEKVVERPMQYEEVEEVDEPEDVDLRTPTWS